MRADMAFNQTVDMAAAHSMTALNGTWGGMAQAFQNPFAMAYDIGPTGKCLSESRERYRVADLVALQATLTRHSICNNATSRRRRPCRRRSRVDSRQESCGSTIKRCVSHMMFIVHLSRLDRVRQHDPRRTGLLRSSDPTSLPSGAKAQASAHPTSAEASRRARAAQASSHPLMSTHESNLIISRATSTPLPSSPRPTDAPWPRPLSPSHQPLPLTSSL